MKTTIYEEIQDERTRQNEKWGEQNHLPIEWIAILTEEVGEASKEALDHHFINGLGDSYGLDCSDKAKSIIQQERMKKYRKEIIQVAAVAVQMIECLDRN